MALVLIAVQLTLPVLKNVVSKAFLSGPMEETNRVTNLFAKKRLRQILSTESFWNDLSWRIFFRPCGAVEGINHEILAVEGAIDGMHQ